MKTLEVTAYRIKRLLEEAGWSQAELGRRVGVSQQTVQRWANGKVSPNPENFDQLSKITGHPVFWFMLPPDEEDQVTTPDTMKMGRMERELLQTFNAFPEEDREKMLKDMKDEKDRKEKEAERWFKAKGQRA
ncbi:helix-turn-helix domain-containing protein [Salmonella enterica]|nr:helix-turn-helix domain-containing protein [Salmonella enterica subsp. enterica]EAW9008144.1 helix-turn-helix domain-containing protein [Salmonella enterica]EAY5638904.1 helix-turn-helix domain-containing protein [Salmonella enterica]EBP3786585.1 helix-turn-helix domain-containing protein [Salmonella enterica subsp. enterica]EBP3796189.1 helix-turn-helix domain-containing protein [Salmonella enterica subsp. enterica]